MPALAGYSRLADIVDRPAWRTARGHYKPKGRHSLRHNTVAALLREGLAARTTLKGHEAIVITDKGKDVLNAGPAAARPVRSTDRGGVEAAAPLQVRAWWLE